jgi:hypothetical protein
MQHIQYFVALCDEQSFTRAAKRCAVSQPSLSNAIKQLEAEMGGPLFERGHKASPLSALGRCVQPHLADIDRSVAAARHAAAMFLAGPTVVTTHVQEKSMRKVVYGVAAVAAVLIAAVFLTPQPRPATASVESQANNIVDVRAIESSIDLAALPDGNIKGGYGEED